MYQIITFYEFKHLNDVGPLAEIRDKLREAMAVHLIVGTIIIADEGFNSTVSGLADDVERFVITAENILRSKLDYKSTFYDKKPFRKIDVKIKKEIVTLKKAVDRSKGIGTFVAARDWNCVISDREVFVLDARNDYEFKNGTFERAQNSQTKKFSELRDFVKKNLDPDKHKKIALFCTGGVRCEKFAPFMKSLGFDEVFQLKGGILRYLEKVPPEEQLFRGECFVFDDRVTIDENMQKGSQPDYSQ